MITEEKPSIVGQNEFLIVRHSYLNGNSLNLEGAIKETKELQEYTSGRQVVPCFEGDLLQLPDGEVILTHQSFFPPSKEGYDQLRRADIAASLDEIMEKVRAYQRAAPEERFFLCFELKPVTTDETIRKTIKTLKENRIENVYFDSFYGGRIDIVTTANNEYGTNYPTSHHLMGNLGNFTLAMSRPQRGYEIITVSYKTAWGNFSEDKPIIYGAVGTEKELERSAKNQRVIGAYARLKEKWSLKMFINSMTNTEWLRKNTIKVL